jgi:TPR repeat protein
MSSKRSSENVNVSSKKQKTSKYEKKEDNVEPYEIFDDDDTDISHNESDISDTEPTSDYSDIDINEFIDDFTDDVRADVIKSNKYYKIARKHKQNNYKCLKKAAKLDHPGALVKLAEIWKNHFDARKYHKYLKKSLQTDDFNEYVLCNIGQNYYKGYGVEKNFEKAKKYFWKAYNAGCSEALKYINECS